MLICSRFDYEIVNEQDFALGPWCFPLPSDSCYNNAICKLIDVPWKDDEEISKAYKEVNIVYEDILNVLSECLNQFHETKKSIRFWRILLGPWLFSFVSIVFDNYNRLLAAKNNNAYPLSLSTYENLLPPRNTFEYVVLASNDTFYLHIIKLIAEYIDFPFQELHNNLKLKIKYPDRNSNSKIKNTIKNTLYSAIQKFFLTGSQIILYKSYIDSRLIQKLSLFSTGNIAEQAPVILEEDLGFINVNSRNKFKLVLENYANHKRKHDVKSLILKILPDIVPICFIEEYEIYKKISSSKFKAKQPKKIVTAIGWHYDDLFKFWSAECAENGTKLLCIQHGGNYGIQSNLFAESHETKISDQYITWGWKDKSDKKIVSGYFVKKTNPIFIKKMHTNKKIKSKILYATTSLRRFPQTFPFISGQFQEYHKNQIEFFTKIFPKILKKTAVRLHSNDADWEIGRRLSDKFEGLNFEKTTLPFLNSVLESKLFIVDHISTTYAEAIALNIPTIIFSAPLVMKIRPDAQYYFDKLEEVGVFHKSGKAAAEFLNNNYSNIDEWWNGNPCQRAIREFSDNFIRNSDKPARDWHKLLSS